MKIKLLITLLMIIPLSSFSQKADTTVAKKMSVGLTFSSDYCYRFLSTTSSSQWIANHRDSVERPIFGYSTGINAAYRLGKRITFEASLLFSDRGEKYVYDFSKAHPIDPEDPFLPVNATIRNHYYYLDISFKVNVNIITKRSRFYIIAGVSPNIFIKSKRVTISEFRDGHTSKGIDNIGQTFTKINIAIVGGLGYSYDLSRFFYLKLEPVFRLSLNSLASTPIKQYEYSAGLNAGFYYIF